MDKKRRRFLRASSSAAVGATLAGCGISLEQGLLNPCRAALPRRLAEHEAVVAAWNGVDAGQVWDAHVHLIGMGDAGSGIWVNPRMQSLSNPLQVAQRLFYLNAGCVRNAPGQVDTSYIERMHSLVDGMGPGVRLLLLAFERSFDERGTVSWDETAFHTPDAYAQEIAARHPAYFEWAASIHPYRADCVEALRLAHRNGARAVKWLPAAMGMNPASPLCDRFYGALRELDMPLVTHAGMERAVPVGDRQALGNPLLLRRALDHGVRVVVAHCATLGADRDLDRGEHGPMVPSFDLFARLMDDRRYGRTLFGDLAAVTQLNRAGPHLATLLERDDWHPRFINGSDYPLPGIMPLYSVEHLARTKLLPQALIETLGEIRFHNPLLFDFVLKRHLSVAGKRLPPQVFETRRFFIK